MLEPASYVLCAVSMWGRSFREHVEAAADAGWDAISVIYPAYRRALEQEGLSRTDMQAILRDSGVAVEQVEVLHEWSFTDRPADGSNPCSCGLCPDRAAMLEMARTLGASTIIATQRTDPMPLEQLAEQFANLCDDADSAGLQVAVEFVPYSALHTVTQVAELIQAAGRANAGICFDTHHHLALGGTDHALASVAPERILMVQVADGLVFPDGLCRGEMLELMMNRAGFMVGEGELDVLGTLRVLDRMGVQAPLGVEVRKPAWSQRAAAEVARAMRLSAAELLRAV